MNRVQRLRAAVLEVPPDTLRSAVRRIGEDVIPALPPPSRALANQLKRAGNPADLLRRVPNAQVAALVADQIADEPLEVTRALLGDAADDPTAEQLHDAVDKALELFDVPIVRVMLATVAVADAEASDLCDELLTTDERFALPDVADDAPAATRPAKSGPSEEVLARRRERKEAQRAAKQAKAQTARPKHKKREPGTQMTTDLAPVDAPTTSRRVPRDLPDDFDASDPLAGAVVIAHIAFDDDLGAKTRPCVVVAASADELLVRPGYSEGGVQAQRWQSHELHDWRAAGLTKPTWIEPDARTIRRADAAEPVGRLTDRDWNALV